MSVLKRIRVLKKNLCYETLSKTLNNSENSNVELLEGNQEG